MASQISQLVNAEIGLNDFMYDVQGRYIGPISATPRAGNPRMLVTNDPKKKRRRGGRP